MVDFYLKNHARDPVHFQPGNVEFSLYNKEEVLKLSVVEISNPSTFNQLGHPLGSGLYDLKMGPFTDRDQIACSTCHLNFTYCPGHIGHISLPLPVVNPLFYQTMQRLLKISCIHCHRFKMADFLKTQFEAQMRLLDLGMINEAQEIGDIASRKDDEEDKKVQMGSVEEAGLDARLRNYLDELMKKSIKNPGLSGKGNRMVESLRKDYVKAIWNQGKTTNCSRCGAATRKITLNNRGFIYEGLKRSDEGDELQFTSTIRRKSRGEDKERFELNPKDLMDHFRALYNTEKSLLVNMFPVLSSCPLANPTDLFFVEILPVPPPRVRPAQYQNGFQSLHPQTQGLLDVVIANATMRQVLKVVKGEAKESLSKQAQEMIATMQGNTVEAQLDNIWKELQNHVDHVLDKNLHSVKMRQAANSGWGLKQLIERKQGIFRMNMMGKRVNHACRTVITPDPNINIDQIGVPEVFAKKLSYPVPVTPWNVKALQQMVMNGPEKHPGAVMIEDEFGRKTQLEYKDATQRRMFANTLLTPTVNNKKSQKPKIVYRHLVNGDAMLLNRQPTLHKPSIMAHKARVLKGEKVMRLHYSNCKSYNADFDGDEMNAHFPQSELARSEAYNIAMSAHQYLGPKDGTPLQGLIQDHVIAGVKITMRGRFFTRSEYLQLIYQPLQNFPGKIKTLPPAILKPQTLWSGKQVLSTVLINLVPHGKLPPNFASTAKIRPKLWQNQPERKWKAGGKPEKDPISMSESEVVVREGILCTGILDKNQYGATPYSLAHLLFELYGGTVCCNYLSGLSQMFTYFLQSIEGFTLSVKDILVRDDANQRRKNVMYETRGVGNECASQGVGAKGEVSADQLKFMMEEVHRASAETPRVRMELDRGYKEKLNPATNEINAVCVPAGLITPFPQNNLQLMVNSGAKGSTVNTTQISCLLGQIELEGKRPPIMISGKSLPSFKPYDTQPRAGGFIDGRFMTGIQPQEFFFHCMAGREGLIDTAVKTSRSGYLQRCLIKLLEGLVVHHDFTVRDSDNTVVQFQYGEDSMDVCKSQYLKSDRLKDLANNLGSLAVVNNLEMAKSRADLDGISQARKQMRRWRKLNKNPEGEKESRQSPFLKYNQSVSMSDDPNEEKYEKRKIGKTDPFFISRPRAYFNTEKEFRGLNSSIMEDLKKNTASRPPPLASTHLPPIHYSAITEVCDEMINSYLKKDKEVDKNRFKEAIYMKVQQASVSPGEPVGVLAAQSVGEPSTQMTLNTFHFAGRGEMNVTLGIPRLREILMVASKILKTPSLTIPFLPGVSNKAMNNLRLKFNRVLVSDILEEVVVTEKVQLRPVRERNITLRYKFVPHKYYKKDFGVKAAQVLHYMESKFFIKMFIPVMVAISKEKKITVEVSQDSDQKVRGGAGSGDGDEDDNNADEREREREQAVDAAMGDMDSSDDEQGGGDEGTDVSRKIERQGDREYEELEEAEVKIKDEVDKEMDSGEEEDNEDGDTYNSTHSNRHPKQAQASPDSEDEAIADVDQDDEDVDVEAARQEELMSSGEPAKRRLRFLSLMEGVCGLCRVTDYSFDTEKEQWCSITLSFDISQKRMDFVNVIKKSAEKGVIHQVKNLKKAFIIEKDNKKQLQTDGINIDVMLGYDRLLDLNKLQCNSIHDMAGHYGIEAAYKTIVTEVKNVFGVYGIEVDHRHLSLIADYMTVDGTYRPFNRIGIDNNPSPLQQMTFETAMGFLRAATLSSRKDNLMSPSACIILGKTAQVGTGSIQLRNVL